MTLILNAANAHGVWQVSDRRVTKFERGEVREVVDDRTIKHVTVWCPDGVVLIGYAGLAYLGRQHLSEWVHGTLLGKKLSLMDVIDVLTEAATNRLGLLCRNNGIAHAFVLGGVQHGKTWVGAIVNHDPHNPAAPITANFESGGFGATEPVIHGAGSGFPHVPPAEIAKVQRALAAQRATPKSSMRLRGLMAYVNRRTAETSAASASVSRECVSVSLDLEDLSVATTFDWTPTGERPVAIPAVMLGADATTPQVLAREWRQFLELDTKTPEARAEVEAATDDWIEERVAEHPPSRPRLHRPRPLHRRKPD